MGKDLTIVKAIGALCSWRAGEIDWPSRIFEDYGQLSAIGTSDGSFKVIY